MKSKEIKIKGIAKDVDGKPMMIHYWSLEREKAKKLLTKEELELFPCKDEV